MTALDPPLVRRNATILSPLRYPGGKRRLVGFVAEALRLSGLQPLVYAEPFAGGASVALQLLASGHVEQAVLGERDPLVASFWRTVFHTRSPHRGAEALVRRMARAPVSVAEWDRLRALHPRTDLGRAAKCLYLNRTSFSGILAPTAGPVGGRAQTSDHGIGCRFPLDRIARRLRKAAVLAPRARVIEGDWSAAVDAALDGADPTRAFVYLDPPFFRKADRLYTHHFAYDDHVRLADGVAALAARGVPFMLSYDAADEIADLYTARGLPPHRVELMYSATGRSGPARAPELVVSNLPHLPTATRLWRSQKEWLSSGDGAATTEAPLTPPRQRDV